MHRCRKFPSKWLFFTFWKPLLGKSRINKIEGGWIYVLEPWGAVAPRKMDLTLICRDRLAGGRLVTWLFLSQRGTRQKERARPMHHQTGTHPFEFPFLICNLLYHLTACCVRPLCEKETRLETTNSTNQDFYLVWTPLYYVFIDFRTVLWTAPRCEKYSKFHFATSVLNLHIWSCSAWHTCKIAQRVFHYKAPQIFNNSTEHPK